VIRGGFLSAKHRRHLIAMARRRRAAAEKIDQLETIIVQVGLATDLLNRTWYDHPQKNELKN
jgi:hypothetical protein